jgi:hypothetical protein
MRRYHHHTVLCPTLLVPLLSVASGGRFPRDTDTPRGLYGHQEQVHAPLRVERWLEERDHALPLRDEGIH